MEQTGPGTMVFLSYPKYYRDAEEKLALVETDLVASSDPEWDYEVSKGIWQLKIKTDGTFQAQHEGDVFTYRFQSLGIGQGSQFRSVDLGEPDFRKFEIIGDTIRWSEVLPDIDLTVRYIHDILKVDVIVKKEFMNDLRTEVKSGGISGDDYLTARFEIPSVFITSQPKQGGKDRDIYAEPVNVDMPLEFIKNDRVVQRLRMVDTYIINDKGERLYSIDPANDHIRSSQLWQLQRDGGGIAEMSANLEDLASAPEGDLVIDPSIIFEGEGFYHGGDIYDAYIDSGNPNSYFGTANYLYLGNSGGEKRILIGVCHSSSEIGYGKVINSAVLSLYTHSTPASGTYRAKAYKGTKEWYMSTVTWNDNGFNNPPSTTWIGGQYTTSYASPDVTLPVSKPQYTEAQFNITNAFKSHYETNVSDPGDKGFLIKLIDYPNPVLNWVFYSTENTSVQAQYRPKVVANFTIPTIGTYRNVGCTDVLDDWPETGNQLRSPKFVFAQDDNIYFKVNGIAGKGNSFYTIRVKSESDQTGIVINLNETSAGIYQNTSGEYLRLSTTTADGSPADTIKVIDEEVLTFELMVSGHVVTQKNVKVDRAEFASCGIDIFDADATGDRATVRNQALTLTKYWDAGDGSYPNNVGGALANPMELFIKNMGANTALNGEADILHISSHGEAHGDLLDETDGALIIRPLNGNNGIVNSTDWNNDAEWIVMAACDALYPMWGLETGARRWGEALKGSIHKAHGICGAWRPIDVDLRDVWNDFWVRLRNNATIMSAYSIAMENHAGGPQPWAIVYYQNNSNDKLKEVTPDQKGIPNLLYLDDLGALIFLMNLEVVLLIMF